jgi:4'-phosphopantetheinyl transferase
VLSRQPREEGAGTGQVAAALDSDTVRVRWLVVENTPHLARWRGMLDPDELVRADRYHFASDRNIYTAAHALLRFMLSEATGISTKLWRFVTGEFGKPALAANFHECNLHFNISHTRGLVACAIARHEVGVDVERSDRKIDLDIARHYFAPEEVSLMRSFPRSEQDKIFFRLWSLKEAFIKATGEGLSRPLDSFGFAFEPVRIAFHPERDGHPGRNDPTEWQFWHWHPANHCVAALAVQRANAGPIRLDRGPARAADIRVS